MPGAENAIQSVDDLSKRNLEAFGKRDEEKWRAVISTIWETYIA